MLSKKKSGKQNKTTILIIFIAAAVLITATAVWSVISLSAPAEEEILQEGVFGDLTVVAGVNVSGMTIEQAEPLVREKAKALLAELSASYTVEGKQYTLTAYQMGAYVDLESTLREAMLAERKNGEEETIISFEIKPRLNVETLKATLDEFGKAYNTEPVNASIKVITDQNDETLSCTGEIRYLEAVEGITVDSAALAERIRAAVEEGVGSMPLAVEPQRTQPSYSMEDVKKNCNLMAEFETTYKDSGYGRRFNIWKMSTVVNGLVLQPGEQWSINEAAGPRTSETGWANAAGINNAGYVDEPGGGICQVSTTLYNALIRSEVTIVERKHHSWPSKYVDVGLDATISTGGPDLIISNPYEYPIAVIVNTDAKDARQVKVSVYGPEMDYRVDFESKIVKETVPGPQETTFDPQLSPGTSKEVKPRKIGLVAEIYKHWYNKDTGEELREPELYYTDTYREFPGTIAYGPSPTPSPTPSPLPSAPAGTPTAPAEQE